MSAETVAPIVHPHGDDGHDPDESVVLAPEPVEVRRNGAVSAVIGAAGSAIAIAYLWRAVGTGAALDWTLCVLMGLLSVTFLRSLLDARTPLLVADEMGVRMRFATQWRALPWDAIDQVVVRPRRGMVHDGRLIITLHHLHRAIEGLQGRALRAAKLNQKMYGAVIAAPLGITTRVSGGTETELADRIVSLSQGRTEVVTLVKPAPAKPSFEPPEPMSEVSTEDAVEAEATPEALIDEPFEPPTPERRHRWLRRAHDPRVAPELPEEEQDDEAVEVVGPALPEVQPEREPVPEPEAEAETETEPEPETAARARGDFPLRVIDAMTSVTERRHSRVRAIARMGDPVPPPVITEFEPEPAYDPIIGPELAAARTRVGLSVDELAERTRIRPHVIESIEVDDFTPCGGDFYARGHIRTLARMLGKDPAPMLEQFESRYATAPVSPRRVFEAELATGMTGSMRSTVGGPNWALLVGVVLALILVWSGVRLFAGNSQETFKAPPPVLNGSAGLRNGYAPPPAATPTRMPVTLTAGTAGAHVQVRSGRGTVVFDGDLVMGEAKRFTVAPPVTVSSDNGGAVSVTVAGDPQGLLGAAGQPASRVFQRPTR